MTLQAYAADQQTAEKILNALLGRAGSDPSMKAAAAVCSHSVRVIDQSVTQGGLHGTACVAADER